MKTLMVLLAALTAGCSAGNDTATSDDQKATRAASAPAEDDLRGYVGQSFSNLVEANPDFAPKRRAVSKDALAAYAESDGIQSPGQLRQLGGRDVLVFAACKIDRCSEASNLVFIDLTSAALHIVHQTKGKSMVIVDGPPDIASFARTSCDVASCNWDGSPARDPAYD